MNLIGCHNVNNNKRKSKNCSVCPVEFCADDIDFKLQRQCARRRFRRYFNGIYCIIWVAIELKLTRCFVLVSESNGAVICSRILYSNFIHHAHWVCMCFSVFKTMCPFNMGLFYQTLSSLFSRSSFSRDLIFFQ